MARTKPNNSNVQPLVVDAHPQEANHFAVGLSDGGVHVFEPLESEGKWGVPPPMENGPAASESISPSVGPSGTHNFNGVLLFLWVAIIILFI